MITNPKFGADPEVFLADANGKFISAIGRIGGSKENPRMISDDGFSAVQEDNVAAEFCIVPSASKEDFIRSLQKPLDYLHNAAASMELSLAIVPSARFEMDQLVDARAQVFGCDPDYNAWTGQPNPRPHATKDLFNLRTAGGHLHIGWENSEDNDVLALMRACDLFIAVPSTKLDDDTLRRNLYGKAGAFRRKTYGGEYRTLSNFWIKSEELMGWVYEQAQKAVEFVNNGTKISRTTQAAIVAAINKGNTKAADHLMERYQLQTV